MVALTGYSWLVKESCEFFVFFDRAIAGPLLPPTYHAMGVAMLAAPSSVGGARAHGLPAYVRWQYNRHLQVRNWPEIEPAFGSPAPVAVERVSGDACRRAGAAISRGWVPARGKPRR